MTRHLLIDDKNESFAMFRLLFGDKHGDVKPGLFFRKSKSVEDQSRAFMNRQGFHPRFYDLFDLFGFSIASHQTLTGWLSGGISTL